MARYGRAPDTLKILPGVSTFVGRTAAEAEELYEELQSLISPAARRALSVEDAGARPRGPAARRPAAGRHGAGDAGRQQPAPLHHRHGPARRPQHPPDLRADTAGPRRSVFKGSPTQVADEMEDWWRSKAADGFTIMAPVQPRGLRDFVDLVVPELQRRGIFRKEYETTTLRGHLGLPDAPSRWHAEQAAGSAARHDDVGMMVLGFTGGALGGHLAGGAIAIRSRRPACNCTAWSRWRRSPNVAGST